MLLTQHWFASAVRSLWQRSANNQNSRLIARICRRPKLKFHRGHARQLRRGHTGHRCFRLSARAASMSQRYLSTSSRNAGHFPGVEVSNASSTVNPKTIAPESAELGVSRTFGLSNTFGLAWFGCGIGQWAAQSNKPWSNTTTVSEIFALGTWFAASETPLASILRLRSQPVCAALIRTSNIWLAASTTEPRRIALLP